MARSIVVATATATVFLGSQRVHIVQGAAWDSDSPAVHAYPDMFSADASRALGGDLEPTPGKVEQKTANPGEKSTAKRLFGRDR